MLTRLHVSDSFSVHHKESSTVHTAIGIGHTGYADCLHVSDSFSVHHKESSTVHTAIGIGHTGYADCLLASSQHNLYDLYLLLCARTVLDS